MPPRSAAAIQERFIPYLPNISLDNFELQVCPEAQVNDDTKLLIFSPGYWAPRGVYATILQGVAALGFNVLAIDHPYDATIVEYPDGSWVNYANMTIPDDILKLLAPRVADVTTVLDAVTNSTRRQELGIPAVNTERIAIFGHSLGGATAYWAQITEARLLASSNIDGGLWGDEITTYNSKPYLYITAANHPASDVSGTENWPYQLGPKWHLDLAGAHHNTLTDFPTLSKLLGTNLTDPAVVAFIGTIDPARMLTILTQYVATFFRGILNAEHEALFDGPSPEFPEISFVKSSLIGC